MAAAVATFTAKGQVTVPKAVREALGLRQGDPLRWERVDGSVRVRAVAPLDLDYLQGLEANLREWSSRADEAAFRDLCGTSAGDELLWCERQESAR